MNVGTIRGGSAANVFAGECEVEAMIRLVGDAEDVKEQVTKLVADRAVQQQLGRYFVTAVGEGDVAEARPVTLGPRVGNTWVVEQGVAAGDRIVVEGLQKARPGTPLKPTVVTAAELDAPAAPAAAAKR